MKKSNDFFFETSKQVFTEKDGIVKDIKVYELSKSLNDWYNTVPTSDYIESFLNDPLIETVEGLIINSIIVNLCNNGNIEPNFSVESRWMARVFCQRGRDLGKTPP